MMAGVIKTIDYSASEAAHHVVITVTGLSILKIRTRVAAQIFRIGAWVAGVQIIIETSIEDR